jgi:hypothetical protein
MLFLSYHENASCSASPTESDLESDATSLPTDVGCMRRSCGPRGSRNDSIGYRSGQRVRENSCSASLAQERVALYLSKVLVAFNLTFERLLVILVPTTKRAIDSRARSFRMGAPHGLRPMSTSRCCAASEAGPSRAIPPPQPAGRVEGCQLMPSSPVSLRCDGIAWSVDQRARCMVILAGIVTPESFIQHDITGL